MVINAVEGAERTFIHLVMRHLTIEDTTQYKMLPGMPFMIYVCLFILSQVNIIPIIAKADTISKSELHKFKIKVMSELVSNGVQIYQFPTEDEAVAEINSSMNVCFISLMLYANLFSF